MISKENFQRVIKKYQLSIDIEGDKREVIRDVVGELRAKGLSNVEIAVETGLEESSVRSLFRVYQQHHEN